MFSKLVDKNIKAITTKPTTVLVLALIITIIAGVVSTGLSLELSWASLTPGGDDAIEGYNDIIDHFPTMSNILVVVKSEHEQKRNSVVKMLEDKLIYNDYVESVVVGLEPEMLSQTYHLDAPNNEDYLDYNTKPFISSDDMVVMIIQPNFDMLNLSVLDKGVASIEAVIESVDIEDVEIGLTGMHVLSREEAASISLDTSNTLILAVLLIFLLLIIAFRSISAPILAFVPLITGLVWTIAITRLVIGRLNIVTAFSAAMLLGLSVDYAIHLYSSYVERRARGLDKRNAIKHALSLTGPGIITGALTTAVAFLSLNIFRLNILSELGTVMAIGIVCSLVAVLWVLPALIMLRPEQEISRFRGTFKWVGRISKVARSKRILVIGVLLVMTLLMGNEARQVEFDKNLLHLEPEGLESVKWMITLQEDYNLSTDALYLTVDAIEDVYKYHEAFESVEGVSKVLSIATIKPLESDNPSYNTWLNTLPEQGVVPENILKQMVSENDDKYLLTIYPDFDIWANLDSDKSDAFFADIEAISKFTTGTPVFMNLIYNSVAGEMLVIATVLLLVFIIILMIHFKKIKYALYALLPLFITLIFMLGTMHLVGLKLNILNILPILLIVGIGIDNGVHILHHYKIGERKVDYLFSRVGKAIFLTTLTTLFGFGSLIFSSYKGIASFGMVLCIGVFYAFIMTVIIMPLMLKNRE